MTEIIKPGKVIRASPHSFSFTVEILGQTFYWQGDVEKTWAAEGKMLQFVKKMQNELDTPKQSGIISKT